MPPSDSSPTAAPWLPSWPPRCGRTASREVSRVQRIPVATCCPCYPGGARWCTGWAPSHRVSPSP